MQKIREYFMTASAVLCIFVIVIVIAFGLVFRNMDTPEKVRAVHHPYAAPGASVPAPMARFLALSEIDAGSGTCSCTCTVPFPAQPPPVVCPSLPDAGGPGVLDASGDAPADGFSIDASADASATGADASADAFRDGTTDSNAPDGAAQLPGMPTGALHVQGTKIVDANGAEFRIRGVNDIGFWRGGVSRAPLIASMKAMGVRAVRIPLSGAYAGDGPGSASTPAYRAALAAQYLAAGIVPIPVEFVSRAGLEVTNAEDPASLSSVVDDWTGPDLTFAKSLQILNIANEWGPSGSSVWRDQYNTAIGRIRTAGITAVLLIDAGGSGEDAADLTSFAKAITDLNVCFSIHEYGAFWHDPANASWQYDLAKTSDALAAIGRCIVVGEFSSKEYNAGIGGWFALDPARVIAIAEAHGFGWIGWELYNDSTENMLSGPNNAPKSYPPAANLTPFGAAIVTGLARH
jgi:hypothetical protein